jgi:hypothetical protein
MRGEGEIITGYGKQWCKVVIGRVQWIIKVIKGGFKKAKI